MDVETSKSIIEAAGGGKAFAKRIGIDGDDGVAQRVNNWRKRGIPSKVVLDNFEEIKRLESLAASGSKRRPQSGTKRSVGR